MQLKRRRYIITRNNRKEIYGDIIEISLELTHGRGGDNNSLYAYYPKINGVECSGIPIIQKLIQKGMLLEEIKE